MSESQGSNGPTNASKSGPKIGWIGTGVMGASMCGHLLRAGFDVIAYNRSASKLASVIELGARPASTVAEASTGIDIVFTIVGFPSDVREVYLGKDGILNNMKAGGLVIDMTTSQPSLAVEIAHAAAEKKIESLDAPVSGGDIGAKEARLSIMVGGSDSAFARALPLFQCMGKTIIHQGAAGAGQHTKMVNQTLIATNMIGVCEALLYAEKAGLDVATVLQSVSPGAAGSWSLSNLAPRILQGDLKPGFMVDHFVKDMGIVLDECRRMKLSLPGLALAHQLYVALQAQGDGNLGTHGLIKTLRKLSGMDIT